MKIFFLFTAIVLCLESNAQFYFKPDSLHQWDTDTVFNSAGKAIEFYINGIASTYYNDTIRDMVQVHTDSIGRVTYIGYSFRDVAATMYFVQGSNAIKSASVFNCLDSTSSLTISTDFISDYERTETRISNRRCIKKYEDGALDFECEEILVNGAWKKVYLCIYSNTGEVSIITKLDDQGNGYHIEYDGQGKIFRSCVYINFEGLNCQY